MYAAPLLRIVTLEAYSLAHYEFDAQKKRPSGWLGLFGKSAVNLDQQS